jgi:hypothetical protein
MRIRGLRLVLGMAAALAALVPFAGTALSHDGTISTAAGNGTAGNGGNGGPATLAELEAPEDVAPLRGGGFLIADSDNHVVREVDSLGIINRVAGNGNHGYSGDGGPATLAELGDIASVSPTADGGFLIADPDNHRVRKVSPLGVIDTVAGTGSNGYGGDGGQATLAQLCEPTDAVELADGSIVIADQGNDRIRKVSPAGVIETVAGTGNGGFSGDGGAAVDAEIDDPVDISPLRGRSDFLFVDAGNERVRKVDQEGRIKTVAGTDDSGSLGDGGPATEAYLEDPVGVTALLDGGFLVADESQHRVRRVDPEGTITTEAGTGVSGSAGDGGMPGAAELSGPADVTASPEGGYYVADAGNHKIRFVWTYDLAAGPDLEPPAAPEIKGAPGEFDNDSSPQWQFKTEQGATTECKLRRDGSPLFDWVPCSSPHWYDLAGEPDGVHTFFVRATDQAGNVGETATARFVLDRVVPAAPMVDGPQAGAGFTPSFTFTGEEGATFKCDLQRDGVTIVATDPCTSPATYDLTAHGAGTYDFSVKAIDAAGNKSAAGHGRYLLEVRNLEEQLPELEPELGEEVVAGSAKGTTMVKVPGSDRWVELDSMTELPVGTRIDARRGVARLSTALDRSGRTQTASFGGGVFEVRQSRRGRGVTDIILRGSLAGCRASDGEASASRRSRRSRRLWGRDRGGRWRTHGQNSVATVRGTRWLTEDRCGGTLTRVTQGAVVVRNKRTGRRVLVKAGDSYFARAKRR